MKKVLLASLALGLVVTGMARSDEPPAKSDQTKPPAQTGQEQGTKQAYLGVAVESLPPFLSAQLRGVLPKEQGVLVLQVAPASPAAKAGLRQHDVLVQCDDQRLYSPEQLIKLIRDCAAGQQVTLNYVRDGKTGTAKATLGDQPPMFQQEGQQEFPRFRPGERIREGFAQFESRKGEPGLELVDAIRLTRLDDHRWRAEIDYRTQDGKKEHKAFEGSRDELRKDIQGAKDLPANERAPLMRALNFE
jgi:hypothetical protein